MDRPVVDVKTSGYFNWTFILVGVVLFLMGVFLVLENIWLSILLIIVSGTILTTHYRLRVDLDKKTYHDYLWIWGMKKGERGTFDHIDCLLIKSGRASQNMHLGPLSSTVRRVQYDGYLRLSENHMIHLASRNHKKNLMALLDRIAKKLNVEVVDYDINS